MKTMMYKIHMFLALHNCERRFYEKAHANLVRAARYSSPHNIKYFLFRAYISVLSEKREDAFMCLSVMYKVLRREPHVIPRYKINDDEHKWLIVFAEYLLISISGERSHQFGRKEPVTTDFIDSIEFHNVRRLFKRLFPMRHIKHMRSLFNAVPVP